MESSYSNYPLDRTQSLNVTRLKDMSKETYKTSKSFRIIPSFQRISNDIFNTKNKDLLINQRYYDPEMLKQQLNSCKAIMHEQKSNYLNLKIKYSQLYNENLSNKNLISNILGFPLDEYLTKDEVMDKIENVKLNKKKRALLEEAFNCISLKMEIEEKKEKNAKLMRYCKELKENSKVKKINDLVDIFLDKCEEQRKLLRMLKYLGEKNQVFEEDMLNIKENLEKEKANKTEIQKYNENIKNQYEELIEEMTNLFRQNKTISEKIKNMQ